MNDMVCLSRHELREIINDAALTAAQLTIMNRPKDRPAQYTKKDAAEELGVSRPTLDKLIRSGNIRLNGCGKVPSSEVERIISCRSSY